MSDNMIGISQITHQPSYKGEYTPIIDLDIDKKYYTSKLFYYDLNIVNIGSSSSTKSPSINLILRLSISDKNTTSLTSNIFYKGLYKEDKIKAYTVLEDTTDKVKLKVLISNYDQSFVRWAVYPNFVSNLYCKNSLLPPLKDVYTTDEFNAITNKTEIKEYTESTLTKETLQIDTITHNNTNTVTLETSLLPKSNGYYNLGNKDLAFKSGYFSHFLKLPYQSKDNVKPMLQQIGGNSYAIVNSQNKNLAFYYSSDDKWYDAFGVPEDKQIQSFTPTLVGDVVEGSATYDEQYGQCLQVGSLLFINIRIRATLDSTIDGYLKINTGLPSKNWGTVNIYSTGFANNPSVGVIIDDGIINLRYRSTSNGNCEKIPANGERGKSVILYISGITVSK